MSQLCCDAVFSPSSPVENLCRSPQVQFIDREFTFPCLVKASSDSASCAELFDVHVLAQVLTCFDLLQSPSGRPWTSHANPMALVLLDEDVTDVCELGGAMNNSPSDARSLAPRITATCE